MPISYHFDYLLMADDGPWALVEIKIRRQRYETLILGVQKAVMMRFYAAQMGIRPLLVVQWDATYFTQLRPVMDYRVDWGGRWDRGDDQDMEPVIHIPSNEFMRMG
jgi:hypothetical protein